MEPRFVEGAAGLPIATWELGGSGPTLLLAHATGFHARCYRALAQALAGRFRVVGFDLRGHGHSATPPLSSEADGTVPAMAWTHFADDALAVVDALGLEGAAGFGHSCGGTVLLLAEQRRPGTLARIYAYEPVAGPPWFWARFAVTGHGPADAALRRREVFASRAAARDHYAGKRPLSSLRAEVLDDYVEGGFAERPDGTVHLRCAPEAEAATYVMAPHVAVWEHLGAVACPTTFACGGAASEFGTAAMNSLASRVRHGRVEVHPDLGHLGPLEDPAEVAAAVAAPWLPDPPTGRLLP